MKIMSFFYYVNLILGFTLMLGLYSCSNEEEILSYKKEDDEVLKNYEWNFIYKGKEYSCQVIDGIVTCSDETRNIIDKLAINPFFVTEITEDGKIVYYDNENEFEAKSRNMEKVLLSSSVNKTHALLKLYQNRRYRGHSKGYDIYADSQPEINVANLNAIGWGDYISSFKISIVEVTVPYSARARVFFYEDIDYGGHSIVYNTDTSVKNLHDVPLFPGSSDKWGDRISSFKFSFY